MWIDPDFLQRSRNFRKNREKKKKKFAKTNPDHSANEYKYKISSKRRVNHGAKARVLPPNKGSTAATPEAMPRKPSPAPVVDYI